MGSCQIRHNWSIDYLVMPVIELNAHLSTPSSRLDCWTPSEPIARYVYNTPYILILLTTFTALPTIISQPIHFLRTLRSPNLTGSPPVLRHFAINWCGHLTEIPNPAKQGFPWICLLLQCTLGDHNPRRLYSNMHTPWLIVKNPALFSRILVGGLRLFNN